MALSFSYFFTWDSNRLIKDSNRSSSNCLLEFGFESLHEGFESPSLVWTLWNVDSNRCGRDSNRCGRDSNRLLQSALSGKWIRIALGGIRIAFISLRCLESGFESPWEGFESPSLNLLEKGSRIEEFVEGFESPC